MGRVLLFDIMLSQCPLGTGEDARADERPCVLSRVFCPNGVLEFLTTVKDFQPNRAMSNLQICPKGTLSDPELCEGESKGPVRLQIYGEFDPGSE